MIEIERRKDKLKTQLGETLLHRAPAAAITNITFTFTYAANATKAAATTTTKTFTSSWTGCMSFAPKAFPTFHCVLLVSAVVFLVVVPKTSPRSPSLVSS